MATILETLLRANPEVDTTAVRSGANTMSDYDNRPSGWIPPSEFNYETLTDIFSRQLHEPYRGRQTAVPDPLPLDLRVCNEATLQLVLDRFVIPAVNHCLYQQSGSCHYGPYSRCDDSEYKPDWSCVAYDRYNINVLPGDTKLSAKWVPAMATSGDRGDHEEWAKVMGQIISYMKAWKSRYGFIITDKHFDALRITRLATGQGLAAEREPRDTGSAAPAYDFDSSGLDSSFANTTA